MYVLSYCLCTPYCTVLYCPKHQRQYNPKTKRTEVWSGGGWPDRQRQRQRQMQRQMQRQRHGLVGLVFHPGPPRDYDGPGLDSALSPKGEILFLGHPVDPDLSPLTGPERLTPKCIFGK